MAITPTGTNPIVVTGTTDAKDDIATTLTYRVTKVIWHKPTAAGHLCALQDGTDAEKAILICDAVNKNFEIDFGPDGLEFVDGIYCDDMDSGTLYVYVK